jgi:surfactin synthase thioesterase subunit
MLQLISSIQVQFQKACELSALYSENTIKRQGVLIDSMKTGLIDGQLLHEVTDFDGRESAIIFIPGVAGTAKDFEDVIKLQQSNDLYTAIGVFRHKGFVIGETYFDSIEENVKAFAEELADSAVKRITLVGHSYGGVLALELANYLKANGYHIKLVMLDTYFEQQKLIRSKNEREAHFTSADNVEVPNHLQRLYKHQKELFGAYKPEIETTIPTLMVFANKSPFIKQRYIDYLDKKLPATALEYMSIDGDHFTMLNGKNAELIAEIIETKVIHNVA